MQEFTYLNKELDEKFIDALNNMQDKYIINEKYRIKLEDIKIKLKEIKELLIKYNL